MFAGIIVYAIVLVLIIPAAIPNMQSIGVLIMQARFNFY